MLHKFAYMQFLKILIYPWLHLSLSLVLVLCVENDVHIWTRLFVTQQELPLSASFLFFCHFVSSHEDYNEIQLIHSTKWRPSTLSETLTNFLKAHCSIFVHQSYFWTVVKREQIKTIRCWLLNHTKRRVNVTLFTA